ncbi:MAG: hypothetical protein LUH41_00485, partial [Clostridiales bacterium]|nr:hypothetical protein [Clostridiales bacterium]
QSSKIVLSVAKRIFDTLKAHLIGGHLGQVHAAVAHTVDAVQNLHEGDRQLLLASAPVHPLHVLLPHLETSFVRGNLNTLQNLCEMSER